MKRQKDSTLKLEGKKEYLAANAGFSKACAMKLKAYAMKLEAYVVGTEAYSAKLDAYSTKLKAYSYPYRSLIINKGTRAKGNRHSSAVFHFPTKRSRANPLQSSKKVLPLRSEKQKNPKNDYTRPTEGCPRTRGGAPPLS
ncbi:MAG: hypothetical protein IK011_06570, partial [Bacteroidaceae bacterium]|nr:hypothetical protein [Bacteroidaceae bacterium]